MILKLSSISWSSHPILLCTIFMNTIVFLGYFYEYPELGLSNNIDYALILHLLCFCFFIIGYNLHKIYTANGKLKSSKYYFHTEEPGVGHRLIFILLLLFGVYSSVETISHSATLQEHFVGLISGVAITRGVEVASADGGAPGYIKAATYLPLVVFGIYIVAIRRKYKLKVSDAVVFIASILVLIFKTLFTLDRLTIMYLMVGLLIIKDSIPKQAKAVLVAFAITVCVFFLVITSIRQDGYSDSLVNGLFLYARLGLENLQILIENGPPLTFGSQTLFNPILFLLDKLGLTTQNVVYYKYIWNPAHYAYGHLFMDYHFMSIPAMFFYGLLTSHVESRSRHSKNKFSNALLLPLAINSFSGIGVMWLRGIEFYVVILGILILQPPVKYSVNSSPVTKNNKWAPLTGR